MYDLWCLILVIFCLKTCVCIPVGGQYSAESYVLLTTTESKTDFPVPALSLRNKFDVDAIWKNIEKDEALFRFKVPRPTAWLRGAGAHADFIEKSKVGDEGRVTGMGSDNVELIVEWSRGHIVRLFSSRTSPILLNFARGLVSLWQLGSVTGASEGWDVENEMLEHNETDVTGECRVQYERLAPYVFRKIKRACAWGGANSDSSVHSQRVTRFELDEADSRVVRVAHAEEVHVAGAEELEIRTRAWLRAEHIGPSQGGKENFRGNFESLAAAGEVISTEAGLQEVSLSADWNSTPADPHPNFDIQNKTLKEVWEEERATLRAAILPGSGGDSVTARSTLRLAAAMRSAGGSLRGNLEGSWEDAEEEAAWWAAAGAAGYSVIHVVASRELALKSREPHALAEHYLRSLALASRPDESVVQSLIKLSEEARDAGVRSAAIKAACGARVSRPTVARSAHEAAARTLQRCGDARDPPSQRCVINALLAIGACRSPHAATTLLQYAESGDTRVSLAALDALATIAIDNYSGRLVSLYRLRDIALGLTKEKRPLAVRVAAADLIAQIAGGPADCRLCSASRALVPRLVEGNSAGEGRRALLSRLEARAARSPQLRETLRALPHRLRNWDEHAPSGMSSVQEREVGWGAGGRSVLLDSAQLVSGGVLRRGQVALRTTADHMNHAEIMSVELYAEGLATLAGGEDDDETASAVIAVRAAGIPLHEYKLFSSQAELLAAVWAGAGGEPTPLARFTVPLFPGTSARVPLATGGILNAAIDAATSVALDASIVVSLWSRTARARLRLAGGVYGSAGVVVRGAGSDLNIRMRVEAEAEPRASVTVDADFYARPTLCVRAHVWEVKEGRNATVKGLWGTGRVKRESRFKEGRTLDLGRENSAACNALAPQFEQNEEL